MTSILLVHHSPTTSLRQIAQAVRAGVEHPDLDGAVTLNSRPALEAEVSDVIAAAGVVLLTPVNFGYMSGALKHFFDCTYRDLMAQKVRRPHLAVIKGTTDADGAVRALEAITTGLKWQRFRPPVVVEGPADQQFLDRVSMACAELAASLV
ncbi:MAG: NAD(P)H-dependent oxidoreductase [Euzebya sp.]